MIKSRGFTLVEMLAVISVSSVLLVIATGVVHRAMRVHSQWETQADANRAWARLAHDYRNDVHQCEDMLLTQNPTTIKLTFPDSTVVTYEVAADEIIRDHQSPGEDRRREFYEKPQGYEVHISINDDPRWVELQVTRDPKLKGVEPRVVLHIQAEAGRFIRLAQVSGETP
jgi:prepilin-type N-terminal cleavage/methylation domain-containing protein